MAAYRNIDSLLLNTNKGIAGVSSSKLPAPGDGVTVSVAGRGLLNIIVHHIDPVNLNCRGEALERVADGLSQEIVARGEHVTFDYTKIAGIHRR